MPRRAETKRYPAASIVLERRIDALRIEMAILTMRMVSIRAAARIPMYADSSISTRIRILHFLSENAHVPFSTDDISEVVGERDGAVRVSLSRLATTGLAQRVGVGMYRGIGNT